MFQDRSLSLPVETDPEDHQPLARSLLGDRGGEANMEKSQKKGKVSDGHNVQLAVLMAGKRNRVEIGQDRA